jgi:hypothetical protein
MPITTLSALKTQLAITDTEHDDFLTELQTAAESFVQAYCGRDFQGGLHIERHTGPMIFLQNYPIDSVGNLRVNAERQFGPATELDPKLYAVYPERGVVSVQTSVIPGKPDSIEVKYNTSSDATPAVVLRAINELVSHWFREAQTHTATGNLNILSQTSGSTTTQYPWNQSTGYRIPPAVIQMLAGFRMVNV